MLLFAHLPGQLSRWPIEVTLGTGPASYSGRLLAGNCLGCKWPAVRVSRTGGLEGIFENREIAFSFRERRAEALPLKVA